MDLTFTEAEEEFRHEARTWLEANVPAVPLKSMDTAVGFEQHREWEKSLYEGRWSVVSWPEKYGGRDCSLIAHRTDLHPVGEDDGAVTTCRVCRP